MPSWKEPGRHAQSFATAGNSRADSPDWQVHNRCGFVVAHPFQPDEQDHRPLLLGQLGEGALHIAQVDTRSLIRRADPVRIKLLQLHAGALARGAAKTADMLMVENCKQPSPKIGPLLPEVEFSEGAGEALLNEIIHSGRIVRQNPRVPLETRDQSFDFAVKFTIGATGLGLFGAVPRRRIAFVAWPFTVLNVQTHHTDPY